jgi:site-specific recombinase XerD
MKDDIDDKLKADSLKTSHIDPYVSCFNLFLEKDRGLAPSTRHRHCYFVHFFLLSIFGPRKFQINKIAPQDIIDFILSYSEKRNAEATRNMVSSLRSFFRFLKIKNIIDSNLADFIPPISCHRSDRLPEHLSKQELNKLLKSCNKKTVIGVRDYAILLMLSQLGVRSSEVIKLTLDDIDWNRAEIIINGKGAKKIIHPLFQDLGEAFIAYLKTGRPKCETRSFFVTTSSPFRGLSGPSSIGSIVCNALKRAGLNPRKKGAHLLRHTLATQLLRQGASLQEVGQVLNHHHVDTTAIYAKVDFERLRLVVRPWPKGAKFGGPK